MTTEEKYKRDMQASIVFFVLMVAVFLYCGHFGTTLTESLAIGIVILLGLSRCLMWAEACKYNAYIKGHSAGTWEFIGFLLGLLGLIIVLCLHDYSKDKKDTPIFQTGSSESDAADAILKYKNLLDQGIITQEEFDKKKTELLNK